MSKYFRRHFILCIKQTITMETRGVWPADHQLLDSSIHWQSFKWKSFTLWPNVLAVKGNSAMWCWTRHATNRLLATFFCCTTHASHTVCCGGRASHSPIHTHSSLPHTYEWPFEANRWPSAQQATAIISLILKLLLCNENKETYTNMLQMYGCKNRSTVHK